MYMIKMELLLFVIYGFIVSYNKFIILCVFYSISQVAMISQ